MTNVDNQVGPEVTGISSEVPAGCKVSVECTKCM